MVRGIVRYCTALALAAACTAAFAQVRVEDAWVRGSVPGQRTSAAYMTLTSPTETTLVGASSPVAGGVELHETIDDGGVMRMRATPRAVVPANRKLELRSGGLHLMLMSLDRELKPGERVPITLTFEDRSGRRTSVDVSAIVRTIAGEAHKRGH
jgi:copper(I)-binding protein